GACARCPRDGPSAGVVVASRTAARRGAWRRVLSHTCRAVGATQAHGNIVRRRTRAEVPGLGDDRTDTARSDPVMSEPPRHWAARLFGATGAPWSVSFALHILVGLLVGAG